MTDLQQLKSAIDELSRDELNEIYNHLVQRRQPTYWLVPSENLSEILEIMRPLHDATEDMTEEEINAAIDEALEEVRRERKK
jgi:hypothetical protein